MMALRLRRNKMEIERKWIFKGLKKIPEFENLELIKQDYIARTYLDLDNPEVRITKKINMLKGNKESYSLTVKSKDTLSRVEIQDDIPKEFYDSIHSKINYPDIWKLQNVYRMPDGVEVVISEVDPKLEFGFVYAEIEFESEEEANKYVFPFDNVVEVTSQREYYLGEYWKRTRLNNPKYSYIRELERKTNSSDQRDEYVKKLEYENLKLREELTGTCWTCKNASPWKNSSINIPFSMIECPYLSETFTKLAKAVSSGGKHDCKHWEWRYDA